MSNSKTIVPEKIVKFESMIDQANTISILMHANPDGDTMGSALALYNVLVKTGKTIHVISTNHFADFYRFLPGTNKIRVFDADNKEVNKKIIASDLVFCMDFNASHRTGSLEDTLNKVKSPKILIDHHLLPDEDFFDLLFSEPGKSSTSELLFEILMLSKYKDMIDKDVATDIFVGIVTDTGSFSHSCNDPATFETSGKLIRYGLNVKEINDMIYNNSSEERLRLLGYAISEKLVTFPEYRAAYFSLSREEMKRFKERPGFTEGVVNYGLAIKGVDFAALFTEKEGLVKISFRSKANLNVNRFARDHFNGGGHVNAAGGRSLLSLDDTLKKLDSLLPLLQSDYYD
ncbi:MAG: bifunctional oligoribonuclease/PAP phosphatase NrnA [Bacteroidales bacterium]|nr:bifunctional oligoribonuclease/PAP phosphatase NrnA [Bacteroidales bacterium]